MDGMKSFQGTEVKYLQWRCLMLKTTVFFILYLVLSSCSLAGLTGCGRDNILTGTELAAVLNFSEAAIDNLFAGFAAKDYETFARDFDSDMYDELPPTNFDGWAQILDHNYGNYLSRQVDQVIQSDEFYVVFYHAQFKQEKQVKVTVAFHVSDRSIAMLSFTSEKYSWSAFD